MINLIKRRAVLFFVVAMALQGCTADSPSPAAVPAAGPTAATVSKPVITNPVTLMLSTNTTAVTILGTCTAGNTVQVSGDDTGSATCTGAGNFSYTTNILSDGPHSLLFAETNGTQTSALETVNWINKATPPANPVITSPAQNPTTTANNSITLSGTCENGDTVNLAGDTIASAICGSTVAGQFDFTFTPVAPGSGTVFNFSITQTDSFTNVSGAATFQWTYDNTVPMNPVITTVNGSAFPGGTKYSSNATITISGTCNSGGANGPDFVLLSGDIVAGEMTTPAGITQTTCAANAFTFVMSKPADGTFVLSLTSQDQLTLVTSGSTNMSYVLDRVAPLAPVIVSPTALTTNVAPYISPGTLTISGTCEVDSVTTINEPTALYNTSTICSAGATYSFAVSALPDGVYAFTISQIDLASNVSIGNSVFYWTRNSSAIPVPTITSPSGSPAYSTASSFTLGGACTPTYTVVVGGSIVAGDVTSPAGSLTKVCPAGGSYAFVISKPTDGAYALTVAQKDSVPTFSATVPVTWVKDTTLPTLGAITAPASANAGPANFTFAATDTNMDHFTCSLDGAAATTCVSPYAIAAPSLPVVSPYTQAHSLVVKAYDKAGNISTFATKSWTQYYKTMALYHFDDAGPTNLIDSGYYANSASAAVSAPGTFTWGSTKKVGSFSLTMTPSTGSTTITKTSPNVGATYNTMTIEGWFRFKNGIPAVVNTCNLLASKTGDGLSANRSWELRLCNTAANTFKVSFRGSTNGTAWTEILSSAITISSTTAWNHLAVTYDLGTVNMYYSAGGAANTSIAPASPANVIGVAGSTSLFTTASPLMIGSGTDAGLVNGTTNTQFTGRLDEFRISNFIRYTTTFTPTTTAFTND